MPIAAAMTNPAASRFRLALASPRNSEVGQISHATYATSLADGTKKESAARAETSQTQRAAMKTSTPIAVPARRRLRDVVIAPIAPRPTRRASGAEGHEARGS